MGNQDRLWQGLKSRYLRQVRKALARTKHPRRGEILEEVASHLDQRYADLDPHQRTRERLMAIIEEMGPATDFTELLEPVPQVGAASRRGRLKYLCSAGLAAVLVLAVVLIAVALSQESGTYVVRFKAVAPFHPRTAAELLTAFNEKCPRSIPTHHFRTKVEGGALIGLICVDTEPAKDKLIGILKERDRLELVGVDPVTEEGLQAHAALGQPSLKASEADPTYVVSFQAVAPFAPATGRDLLDAFNATPLPAVRTHHYRTQMQEGRLIGQICVDTEAGKDAVVSMLKASGKLQLVKAELLKEGSLEPLSRPGRPGLKDAGGGSNAAHRARSPRTMPEPRASGATISRTGSWPAGECSLQGTVCRRVMNRGIDHAAVCLTYENFGSWTVEMQGNGFFFDNLPQGTYTLKTVDTAGYKDTYFNPRNSAEQPPSFELVPGRQVDARIEIEPTRPYRQAVGRILDETGRPLTDSQFLRVFAWVQCSRGSWKGCFNWLSSADVAQDGSYTLGALDGRPVYLQVCDSRPPTAEHPYPPCFYPGTFSRGEAKLVTFDDAEVLRGLDITVRRTGGLALEGVVTTGDRGEPVAEALVSVFHADMFFDMFYTYTDGQGRYRLDGLGEGTFVVHVDAVHRGYIKTRKRVTLGPAAGRLDFALNRGVDVRGTFVDGQRQPYPGCRGVGHATNSTAGVGGGASNFPYGNKFAPEYLRAGLTLFYRHGEGDAPGTMMVFPDETSFLLPAVAPGEITLRFVLQSSPRGPAEQVQAILHEGRDIRSTSLTVKPGQEIRDIQIVVAPRDR